MNYQNSIAYIEGKKPHIDTIFILVLQRLLPKYTIYQAYLSLPEATLSAAVDEMA